MFVIYFRELVNFIHAGFIVERFNCMYLNECAHEESNLPYGWLGSSCLHDAIYVRRL